jgi:hypothetical protein
MKMKEIGFAKRGEEKRGVKSSPAQEGPEIHSRKKHGMRK